MSNRQTMRQLVEADFVKQFNWLNVAVNYDNPLPMPLIQLMTDEELFAAYQKVINIGPIA